MNFEQVSQNGIVPPTSYFNKQSKFAVIVSSTGTVVGQPLILKAISDADIYHEQPVVFYVSTNSGGVFELGQATWTGNFAPLVTTHLASGTNSIYATWPGQDKFAPQSTINSPSTVTVASGYPLGGTQTFTSTATSLVIGEGTATFTIIFNTSTQLSAAIQFFDGHLYLGSSAVTNNGASIVIDTLTVGSHDIIAVWPGETIGGKTYEGISNSLSITILAGATANDALVLTATPSYGVVAENSTTLIASFTSSTVYNGSVNFYKEAMLLGTGVLSNNAASAQVSISTIGITTGTYTLKAVYDGNPSSHPRYLPVESATLSFEIRARDLVDSAVLTVSPNPDVADFQTPTISVALGSTKTLIGNVNFYDGNTLIGSSTVTNNSASLTYASVSTGTHNLTALYSGSATAPKYYSTTTNAVTLTVVSAFAYPGTMTLSGPSSFNKLSGNETLTLTGSVNTLTSGLVTLSQIITTATTTLRTLSTASFTGSNVVQLTVDPTNLITPPYWYSFTSTNYQMLVGTTSFDNNGLYVNTYASILSRTITVDYLKSNPMYFTVNSSLPAYQNIIFQIDTAHVELIGTNAGKNLVGFLFYPVTTIIYTPSFYPDVNDTTGYSATFNKGIAHTTPTNVFNIVATWAGQGIPSLGYTPYYGTNSNILTQTIVEPTITLSGSTASNNIVYANTFTVTINTSSIVANIVKLYNGSSVVATSSITTGNNVVVTLSAGTLPIGTNTISAVLTTTNQTVTSNSISKVIVGARPTTLTVTNSTSTYNYYTSTGTVSNTTITTNIDLIGQNANHSPLGTVVLKTSTGTVIASGSATSISSTVSNITFTWVPSFLGLGNQTITVEYQDDIWNAPASTTTSISLIKNQAVISIGSTNRIVQGGYSGHYLSPISVVATFNAPSAPTTVNWIKNGNFVTSTAVTNGKANLNNLAVGAGNNYFSVQYDETSVYSGSTQELAIVETSYWAPEDLQPTLTGGFIYVTTGYLTVGNVDYGPGAGYVNYSMTFGPAITNPPTSCTVTYTSYGGTGGPSTSGPYYGRPLSTSTEPLPVGPHLTRLDITVTAGSYTKTLKIYG